MDTQFFIELFFSGLTRGSIYAPIAIGYTLVYGIIELINFAHGEIYMLGAFTALLIAGVLGIWGFPTGGILIVAALAAIIWGLGLWLYAGKVAYKPLRGAPRLAPDFGNRDVHFSAKLCASGPDIRFRALSTPFCRKWNFWNTLIISWAPVISSS